MTGDGIGGTLPAPAFPAPGKPKRKAIPVRVHVDVAIAQAARDPRGVVCPLCNCPLQVEQPRVLEHLVTRAVRLALGLDPDAPEILAHVHKACADRKTYGNAATCADGDIHKIAKGKRLAVARAVHDAVKRGEHVRPASRLKGRGFAKVHRPFRRAAT